MCKLTGHWMNWDEISLFKEQIVEMEIDLTKRFHYQDREVDRSYHEARVNLLEQYLKSGNTFFWGVQDGNLLACYNWSYITDFLGKKRWVMRSLMVREGYRSQGFGRMAVEESLKMAIKNECYDAATDYAPFNEKAGALYKKMGYEVTRIELVKKL